MYIRKSGEMRKDFIIEKLKTKLEIVGTELANLNASIDVVHIAKEEFAIAEIQEQISEIQDFIDS